MHPLVKYCQFGESLVNHSDSDANFRCLLVPFFLWCFFLFYVLVFNTFVLLALYVCFHILVNLTDWPPIGKIAAHSAYEMFSWY